MKKFVTNFSLSILTLFILIIVASLIIGGLNFKGILVGKGAFITTTIVSLILFFIVGFMNGWKTKKRGLLNGVILSLFYALFLLLFYGLDKRSMSTANILIDASRIVVLITGSILGVNGAQKHLK